MPNPTKGPRLGGSPAHERIMLANLAAQLFEHGRITTTETKAKRVRPLAEKLITKAKRGDLHARRLVLSRLGNRDVVHQLFAEIAPKLDGREGGYTRITKVGNRKGDNAPMAVIEIVTESVDDSRKAKQKAATKAAPVKKAAAKPAAKKAVDAAPASQPSEPSTEALADELGDVEIVTDETATDEPSTADLAEAAATWGPDAYVGEEPPAGYDIKGNADSMKYRGPSSGCSRCTRAWPAVRPRPPISPPGSAGYDVATGSFARARDARAARRPRPDPLTWARRSAALRSDRPSSSTLPTTSATGSTGTTPPGPNCGWASSRSTSPRAA